MGLDYMKCYKREIQNKIKINIDDESSVRCLQQKIIIIELHENEISAL